MKNKAQNQKGEKESQQVRSVMDNHSQKFSNSAKSSFVPNKKKLKKKKEFG